MNTSQNIFMRNWCKILTDGMTMREGHTGKVIQFCISLSGVLKKKKKAMEERFVQRQRP